MNANAQGMVADVLGESERDFDPVALAREMIADGDNVIWSRRASQKVVGGLLKRVAALEGRGNGALTGEQIQQPAPQVTYLPVTNMMADNIRNLTHVVHDWAKKKGWWDKPEWRVILEGMAGREDVPPILAGAAAMLRNQDVRNRGELLALIHSEASECLEALRKPGTMDDKVPELTGEAAELADIVIRILDYCGGYGIDLGEAIQKKHAMNIGRPHKHGKEF